MRPGCNHHDGPPARGVAAGLTENTQLANTCAATPRESQSSKVMRFHEWSLAEMVDVDLGMKAPATSVLQLPEFVPYEQMAIGAIRTKTHMRNMVARGLSNCKRLGAPRPGDTVVACGTWRERLFVSAFSLLDTGSFGNTANRLRVYQLSKLLTFRFR